tara:strand:+ start:7237 stop:8916 length:1680 start_codon:yes stop_codon:yes gene_type:complete
MTYRTTRQYFYLLFGILLITASCQKATSKADLIVTNAKIWTGNEQKVTAQSMAILGDSIIAVGSNEDILKLKGNETEVIDVTGGFITPGFIDTHAHIIGGGNSLLSVELRDASTPEEFTRRIAAYAKSIDPGTWILEGNWDHTLWGGELPKKEWIDQYTTENPVFIYRMDGHMVLANSLAMEIAGTNKNTADIVGGEIIRNEDGIPTGIFKDNAMNLLFDKMPPFTDKQNMSSFKAAMRYFSSHGVTSVHDMNGLDKIYGSYGQAEKLREADELLVRIYAVAPLSEWNELAGMDKENDKWLKTGGLKGFIDGSLGSGTAAFIEPYSDKVKNKGFLVNSEEDLYEWISSADKENLQVMVHAIGDRAIQSLLTIYERIFRENGKKDRRLRIEHAQHIAPEDFKRFAELGVIASMQPYHAIDDGRWAEERIGPDRTKTAYAFNSLMEANAVVAFGSDWPVAPAAPLKTIYAAVTRRTLDDKNPDGWVPEQKITVEQALTAHTKYAAYASFDENIKGTLEPGKLADFIILSEDLFSIKPASIKDVKVLQTYVGGKKVYDIKIE